MKIALIGYGKMGRMIEGAALDRGHEISCRIDRDNTEDFGSEAFRNSDVAIEFSTPATAAANIGRCFDAGVPVVCGTTGWTSRLGEMRDICNRGSGTLLWASNFSVGVNVFMALNRYAARIMNGFPQYRARMTEVHHIHKLDHPSGTAVTLAEGLISESDRLEGWTETEEGAFGAGKELGIAHRREGEVPGIHTVTWESGTDLIEMTHSAKSREGFALGAVLAAEWLAGRKGYHTIGEVLNDLTGQNIF